MNSSALRKKGGTIAALFFSFIGSSILPVKAGIDEFEEMDRTWMETKIKVRANRNNGRFGNDLYRNDYANENYRRFSRRAARSNNTLPTWVKGYYQVATLVGTTSDFANTNATNAQNLKTVVQLVSVSDLDVSHVKDVDIAELFLHEDVRDIDVMMHINVSDD